MKKFAFPIIFVLLSVLSSLLFFEIAIRTLWKPYMIPFSKVEAGVFNRYSRGKYEKLLKKYKPDEKTRLLGWDIQSHHTEEHLQGVVYNATFQRTRGSRIFSQTPKPDVTRIAAFGDSFIFGQCVGDDEYWAPVLAEKYKGMVEIMNFGVKGYGTDQAFLKYREIGAKFKPDIVMIGIFMEDFFRNVNMFRSIYLGTATIRMPPQKPRFILEDAKLRLIKPEPMRRLYNILADFENFPMKQHEYFYYKTFLDRFPLNSSKFLRFVSYKIREKRNAYKYALSPGSEPFDITLAIVSEFSRLAKKNGSIPFVTIIPANYLLKYNYERAFEKALEKRGIRYLNLKSVYVKYLKEHNRTFRNFYDDFLVPKCVHFNKLGSRIMAEGIYRYLDVNKKIFFKKGLN